MRHILALTLLLVASPAFALPASCQRTVRRTESMMNQMESKCERAQNRVRQLELRRDDQIARLRERENIANIRRSTSSVGCALRELFPGECAARQRQRAFVERINRVNDQFNRRIQVEQQNSNRLCERYGQLRAQYDAERSECKA